MNRPDLADAVRAYLTEDAKGPACQLTPEQLAYVTSLADQYGAHLINHYARPTRLLIDAHVHQACDELGGAIAEAIEASVHAPADAGDERRHQATADAETARKIAASR